MTPTLYYDLGSPYAYLAVERVERVLGVMPFLQPILLGAIFQRRGHGSWARTSAREDGMAVIELRAARYGLEPIRWPSGWPANTLTAMRAATWATRNGGGDEFCRASFRAAFVEGADLGDEDVLAAITSKVGLEPAAMLHAVKDEANKAMLRAATEEAWELGVSGVPTLAAEGKLFFGDDQLEAAADAWRIR